MMRFLFGALLALLIAVPTLLSIVLTVIVAVATQPAVLAFAAGVIVWPRLARTVRGWTA
ncbi:hypothetical protein [Streptomyces alfalfae]|uniref:Uncharacterized protein n=1 Tax=Streptomyces alfalfae TaxID=1642299 RepID=A0A7T4PGH7_9ACTN|nr:hypothetical protein [Streptomyces alfalfae]QQC89851.1 hypothetical protein I8755_16590 [Streptomyces alfalfae]